MLDTKEAQELLKGLGLNFSEEEIKKATGKGKEDEGKMSYEDMEKALSASKAELDKMKAKKTVKEEVAPIEKSNDEDLSGIMENQETLTKAVTDLSQLVKSLTDKNSDLETKISEIGSVARQPRSMFTPDILEKAKDGVKGADGRNFITRDFAKTVLSDSLHTETGTNLIKAIGDSLINLDNGGDVLPMAKTYLASKNYFLA